MIVGSFVLQIADLMTPWTWRVTLSFLTQELGSFVSLSFDVNQNKDIKDMNVTRDEAGEDRPPSNSFFLMYFPFTRPVILIEMTDVLLIEQLLLTWFYREETCSGKHVHVEM